MQRENKQIQQYKEELLKMKEQGLPHREMAEKLGYKKSQIKEFFCSYNEQKRKIQSGLSLKKKRKTTTELQLHSAQGFQYTSN